MRKREEKTGRNGAGAAARVRRAVDRARGSRAGAMASAAAARGAEAAGGLWEDFLRSTGLAAGDAGDHALVEPYSYEFTPSFVHHNGRAASVVQLYNRKGQNRAMSFQDVLDLIPTSPRDGVKIYLVEVDGVIRDDEKKTLIKKNSAGGRQVIEQEDREPEPGSLSASVRGSVGGSIFDHEKDASEREYDRADLADYDAYEMIVDSAEPVVYYNFLLVVVGPDQETVDEQIGDLNVVLDQRHEGLRWDSSAGDQRRRFRGLFSRLEKASDGSVDTATGSQYAGINFAASPGLCDPEGVIIGQDSLALVPSAAVFDFERSQGRLSVVAVPESERVASYEVEGMPHVPVSSILAQAAANEIVVRGHRAVHMVLNGFDYLDGSRSYIRPVTPAAFAYYDAATTTVNPLQGFGDIEDVVGVYSRLRDKIVNIFDILSGLKFDASDTGAGGRALVAEAVDHFYKSHGLWSADAALHPYRTNIVDIRNPAVYPTMSDLISEFTTYEAEARAEGNVSKADRAAAMHSLLGGALTAHQAVLGRPTSIRETDALQTYYDFSRIGDAPAVQAQFLNLLHYVLHTVGRGDLIVVHGTDRIWRHVLRAFAAPAVKAAQAKGVRVLFAFDVIESPETSDVPGMNHSDLFAMRGPYYTDFATDVSWSAVGAMTEAEIARYASGMNGVRLSSTIVSCAQTRGAAQVLVHRDDGMVNNFVCLDPLI